MGQYLHFDPEDLKENFSTRGITFRHSLAETGLFELGHLAEVAQWFHDNKRDEHHIWLTHTGETAGEGLGDNKVDRESVGEAVRNVATNRVWTVIRDPEGHPSFEKLVQDCREEFAEVIPAFRKPEAWIVRGWIFITSPNGVTPYHIDKEWGLIAQIHGTKNYTAYDPNDRAVLSAEELEDFYRPNMNAAKYDESKDRSARHVRLLPGEAVTQPRHTPHLISVEDDYSVTFGMSLLTRSWADEEAVYHMNRIMRRAGFSPDVIGVRPTADRVKGLTYRAANKALRTVGIRTDRVQKETVY